MDLLIPFKQRQHYFNWGAILLASAILIKTIGGISIQSDLLIAPMLVFLFIKQACNKDRKVWLMPIFLMAYIPLSILIANPDPCFNSWQRYLYFLLLSCVCMPIFLSKKSIVLRTQLFKIVILFSIAVSFISFFCYFAGINLMMSVDNDFIEVSSDMGGTFSGITNQSMVLGPLGGIAAISLYHLWQAKHKLLYLTILIPCAGAMLLAASRSALVATIAGMFVVIYCGSKNKRSFFNKLLVIVFVGAISFPLWQNLSGGIMKKQEMRSGMSGPFDSRTEKYDARLFEFEKNPITGVGFGAILPLSGDGYNKETGQIEPGSSWLFFLSSTGMIGLLFFLCILFKSAIHAQQSLSPNRPLLLGLISFVSVHLIAEGYIFSAGSPLCFIVWTIIAHTYDLKYIKT